MRASLLALAIGAFGIGTTEFVIVGLLPEVADDLSAARPRGCRHERGAAGRGTPAARRERGGADPGA
ncbi:hypothetical protein, partial [Streptomyces sp. NPDC041003]|uniref:hypothetical protein n=1 Tax=Streptomyces sp. NPDC041003 TaxID=3155730 RepID=UPI0033E54AFC